MIVIQVSESKVISYLNPSSTCRRSLHIMPFWILFENVMSMHRMKATLAGLMETANVNEWVVTEKFGDTLKARSENGVPELTLMRPKKK